MKEGEKFEAFVHEYWNHYLGHGSPELRTFILTAITSAITSNKAQFIHSATKQNITLFSYEIFKKVADYVIILPDDATS